MWYKNTRFGRFSIGFRPNVWFYGYIWAISKASVYDLGAELFG